MRLTVVTHKGMTFITPHHHQGMTLTMVHHIKVRL